MKFTDVDRNGIVLKILSEILRISLEIQAKNLKTAIDIRRNKLQEARLVITRSQCHMS
jgi:hypothetical protein